MTKANIFTALPENLEKEAFQQVLKHNTVRIERIVSHGHISPDSGWYDQDENEWVMVLQGSGVIGFSDGSKFKLEAGDYIDIPAHTLHKVTWTDPENITIWLAVFYR